MNNNIYNLKLTDKEVYEILYLHQFRGELHTKLQRCILLQKKQLKKSLMVRIKRIVTILLASF